VTTTPMTKKPRATRPPTNSSKYADELTHYTQQNQQLYT